jgi:uncharacterized protein
MMLKSACMALLLAFTGTAAAVNPLDADDQLIVYSRTFLNAHPDLKYRALGMENYAKGRFPEALHYFRLGAYYADKPSQGMVAEMLWKGEGADVDRPLAYAWMDLAAERLYKDLIIQREKFWAEMTPDEREQAIREGKAVYRKYGDDVAQRRLKNVLERNRRFITGSRTGFVGVLKLYVNGPNGTPIPISGEDFYQDKFWKMDDYLQWQSSTWQALPTGTATVGELVPVRSETVPDKDGE